MRLLVVTITLLLSYLFAADTALAYTVKKGDTMIDIASKNNLSLQELAEFNPQIQNIDMIYEGDSINTEDPNKEVIPPAVILSEVSSSEKVSYLDNNIDLLARLIIADAHSEELAGFNPQFQSLSNKTVNTEDLHKEVKYEIASFLDYDIDLLARLEKAESQNEEISEVPSKSIQSDSTVQTANTAEQKETSSKEIVNYSDYEMDLLARLVRAEAQTEPFEGKVAVACVVLNRVESSYFPNTIEDVIYERGQFQPVSNGEINKQADEESIAAVKAALTEKRDMAKESLFFYNPTIATSRWLDSRATALVIGQHVFKN